MSEKAKGDKKRNISIDFAEPAISQP